MISGIGAPPICLSICIVRTRCVAPRYAILAAAGYDFSVLLKWFRELLWLLLEMLGKLSRFRPSRALHNRTHSLQSGQSRRNQTLRFLHQLFRGQITMSRSRSESPPTYLLDVGTMSALSTYMSMTYNNERRYRRPMKFLSGR